MRGVIGAIVVGLLVAVDNSEIDVDSADKPSTMSSELLPVEDVIPAAFDFSLQLQNFTLDENGTVIVGNHTGKHVGFLHGFVESLSVLLVSELGDKTFFIAAVMAMTSNKLTVFLASISALVLMTVLSALLGWVLNTYIPVIYTYYTCTVVVFLFGLKMLWDAYRMKPDEMAVIHAKVHEELQRRSSFASTANNNNNNNSNINNGDIEMAAQQQPLNQGDGEQTNENCTDPAPPAPIAQPDSTEDAEASEVNNTKAESEATCKNKVSNPAKKRIAFQEKSLFRKKCQKIFKVFVNCFVMTFLAEWGDRSQLATIVLAGVNDVFGVCVGASLAYVILSGSAVICGAILAKKMSVRAITFFGGFVFIGFAVYYLVSGLLDEDLNGAL